MKINKAIVLLLFGVLCWWFLGYAHEQVHVVIYRSYGIESTVDYFDDRGSMQTLPEKACPTEECELAHNINEAVGYTLRPIFYFVVIAAFLMLWELQSIRKKLE